MSSSKENQSWEKQMNNPFATVANSQSSGALASRAHRFLACLIDGLLVGVVSSLITVPLFFSGMVPWILMSLVSAAVAFGVFTVANYGLLQKTGQTIGKKVMNLKIATSNGEQPDVQELLVKRYAVVWALTAIPYIGGLLAIGNVLLALRDNRLAGHDEFAKTKVVNA